MLFCGSVSLNVSRVFRLFPVLVLSLAPHVVRILLNSPKKASNHHLVTRLLLIWSFCTLTDHAFYMTSVENTMRSRKGVMENLQGKEKHGVENSSAKYHFITKGWNFKKWEAKYPKKMKWNETCFLTFSCWSVWTFRPKTKQHKSRDY